MSRTNRESNIDIGSKSDSEMSFWHHADALRGVMIRIAITISVASVILFSIMGDIFDRVILAPCHAGFPLYRLFSHITTSSDLLPNFSNEGFEVQLININLASQFFIHISTSFWLALVLTTPAIFYFIWTFISPALYPQEQRSTKMAFFMGNVMFYIGALVGYFLVFPVTLRFLSEYQVSQYIPNQISIESYMDSFLGITFVMGLVFEMPLLCWLLGQIGILNKNFFKKYRRHAIVMLLVLAAFITPTGDPFTLAIVFTPIYMLWEISAFLVPKQENKLAID